ncbi:MAG: peptide MFS transporter [Bryobacteraceae bacterium]|jgi:POT family proton-dependent oligopeptide transporter
MTRPQDTRFFGHPVGLSTLFFTELWERFGYYGMRALLILFMVAPTSSGGLGMDVMTAGSIYGLYTASVYMVCLPGGWLADRFLGQRKAVLWGGILIAIGYLMLAAPDVRVFYTGLCVVVCGTGLLKPNISTIVGQLYGPEDPRRDAGFSIFYMGINLGATIAPLICGYAGQRIDWHLGFALSGVGMTFGVIQFWLGRRHLGDAGLHPVPAANPEEAASLRRLLRRALAGVAGIGAAMAFVHLTGLLPLTPILLVNSAGVVLLTIVVALFAWMLLGGDWTPLERKRLAAILVLFIAASLFWSAYEQAGSSLSLFADRSSDNVILHFEFPASWYQSLNSLFIVALAPLLAWLWVRLGKRQPSSPAKFALGLVFVGLGYVVLVFGALLSAHGTKVTPLFLVVTYLMHTVGELCLSPVGLSAITKLAPARVGSFMMGVWFISISIGDYLGARLTSFYGALPVPTLFGIVACFSIVAGIGLFLIARPVTRLMGGVR